MNNENILVFMPPLVALLYRAEELKGSALSEKGVLNVRDISETMLVPIDVAKTIETERGYADINPDNCWEEWKSIRTELFNDTD